MNRNAVEEPRGMAEHTLDLLAQGKDGLVAECRSITRYLTGRTPPPALIDRYRQGHAALLSRPPAPADLAVAAFVRRCPWTLPYLDAAAGLVEPRSLLRKKLLLMVAILETTPEFTDAFFPERLSRLEVFARVLHNGLTCVVKTLVGLAIYPFAAREPRVL